MKNSLETRLGMFAAVVAIAAIILSLVVGGFDQFRRGLRLYALFNTVQELKVGDRVKMAGVEIGQVQAITLDTTNNKVRVTMKINPDAGVKTDSMATVKFTGLIGQNFVALDFGKPQSPLATDGTMLASTEQPDLSAIMTKLDNVASGVENLTKSFSGDKIDNLLGPFTDFLKANRGPLTATIANIQSVSSQISSGKGTVGKLIYDQTLYNTAMNTVSNLESTGDQIKGTIAEVQKIIDDVNSGKGTVGQLVKNDKLYTEATSSMTNLKEILQKINRGQGTIGKVVNDQEFYQNAKLTLQKLDKATEGLEDTGPLTVLSTLANTLF